MKLDIIMSKHIFRYAFVFLLAVAVSVFIIKKRGFFESDSQKTVLYTAEPQKVGIDAERLRRLDTLLAHKVADKKLSGAVLLAARKGGIAYLKSFGKRDVEANDPMQTDVIFRIASQTKAFVSVAIMMLQEEGKLLISDPVSKYLPAFKNTTVAVKSDNEKGYEIVKAKRSITLLDLLTHTAGIGYGYGLAKDLWKKADIQSWYFANKTEPIQTTINRLATLPFDAQPGERFVYGYNTDILGAVVEVVSGMNLAQFLKKRLFDPLGMQDTHFYLPKEKQHRLATVYGASKNGIVRSPDEGTTNSQGAYVDGPRTSYSGGAGGLSTAKDYATFLQMMLNKGRFNGKQILSRKTVELMTCNQLPKYPWKDFGDGFGLGFYTQQNLGKNGLPTSVGEYGWGGAYHSTYWVDPKEELVVVYLTQLIPAFDTDDYKKVRALIYQALE